MFLQVCICPQGGRVSASVHAGMPYPPRPGRHPLGPGRPPWDQGETPPDQADPPRTRQTPPQDQGDTPLGPGRHPPDQGDTPLDQADTPRPGRHPPRTRETPPGTRQTPQDQADPPGTRQTPPRDQGDTTPQDQGDTPPGSRLQHTVYERPVRILLECILVVIFLNIDSDMKLSTQSRPVITCFYDTVWSQHGLNISHLFLRTITIQSCFPTHLIKRELHDKSLTQGVRDQGSWRAEDHGSLLEA